METSGRKEGRAPGARKQLFGLNVSDGNSSWVNILNLYFLSSGLLLDDTDSGSSAVQATGLFFFGQHVLHF